MTITSVVFVHGLGAFPDTTWQKRPQQGAGGTLSGQQISWIRDLLTEDLREARFMFFNYDSTTYNDAPRKDLQDIAMELLQAFDVSRLRQSPLVRALHWLSDEICFWTKADEKQERNRPIIFLCHSYGGLVLKEVRQERSLSNLPESFDTSKALLQGESAPIDHQDITQNTHGIIFLGTPHRGTKYSDYARAAALRLKRLNANPDIFLPLKVNSSALIDQHARFIARYGNLDIVNFYETRALPIFRLPITKWWYKDIVCLTCCQKPTERLIHFYLQIVERFSATFKNRTNALIDSDHSGLNKFDSRKDPGYRKIRFALEYMINRIIKQRKEIQSNDPPGLPHSISRLSLWPTYSRVLDDASFLTHGGNISIGGEPPPCSQGALYVLSISTVNTYTERPNLMNQLVSDLSLLQEFRDPPRSVALWGIGGSGKSQLALRFIEKHKFTYNTVIWIDAQSPVAAIRSYAAAFEKLKLDYPQHVFDQIRNDGDLYDRRGFSIDDNWIIRTVKEWLENAMCKWLVVIDNADNLAWIHDIMPRGRMGSVIITSRDRMVYRFVNHAIHVDKMNSEEALTLLFRSANIHFNSRQKHGAELIQQKSRKHQALLIVDELGYLALAINLAGAYISQHELVQEDLSRYLDFLNENSVALLGNEALRDEDKYHHTVATVWETSFSAINETSPESARLLIFLAHLSTTNIEDRLFDESSNWIYEQKMAHPAWKTFARMLQAVFYFLLPLGCMYLMIAIVPWRPDLQGQALIIVKFSLILIPVVLDIIAMIILGALRQHDVYRGNVLIVDSAALSLETILIVLDFGMGHSVGPLANWLLPNDESLSHLRSLVLGYASAVCVVWVYEKHMLNVDKEMAKHTRLLLDQLDFSHSSIARFFAVMRALHNVSDFTKGWRYMANVAWIILWAIVLKVTISFAIILVHNLWCWIAALLDARIRNRRLTKGWKVILTILNATTSLLGFWLFFGTLFVISIYVVWESRIPGWIPWIHMNPAPLRVSPALVNTLLATTPNGQWNPRKYSDVMAPLTRFSLMQREADSAYSMHVLVRWWARNRLPLVMQQAWARETDRFISMSYFSNTCWSDPLCQQMLIPHLVDVANLGVITGASSFEALRGLLAKLYRSLRLVGKSYGVAADD